MPSLSTRNCSPCLTTSGTSVHENMPSASVDFDSLPLIVEGESKVVRRWAPTIVLIKLKPTVYSYTQNRTGVVEGTDIIRARVTAEICHRMETELAPGFGRPLHAFVGLIESNVGPLLVQKEVEVCNLEVRVKRFHIGSPLHRYRSTAAYPSTQKCGPIARWSRFDAPVVCFDWRHPLTDADGNRLADEPLSDDYAALWMEDIASAKQLAREAFLWLESLLSRAGILLIDICFFIDRSGQLLYGEISPDCLRARISSGHPATYQTSLDKDLWRQGLAPRQVLLGYQAFYERLRNIGGLQ